jgi:uncharacterized protein (TIGR03083 family)
VASLDGDGDGDGLGVGPELAVGVAARTAEIVEALGAVDEDALLAPSQLPGWSRLTIACHLRYGAEALCRMTLAALVGERVSYYPDGRKRQRPQTLLPHPGESPLAVVASLGRRGEALNEMWATLDEGAWTREVSEPEQQPDLGRLTIARLAVLRLTEVEVHGNDLGLTLEDWSDLFVRVALPFRLDWLNARRTNHRAVDDHVEGSWLLVAHDGPTYLVSVAGTTARSHPASTASDATAVIEGSSRDLLALLLGRPCRAPLSYRGDTAFARGFSRAFPGP